MTADRRIPGEAPTGRPWRLVLGDVGSPAVVDDRLPVGTPVMVKTQYLGSWTSGFAVAEQLTDGYRLRRLSDGVELPDEFAVAAVRRETDSF